MKNKKKSICIISAFYNEEQNLRKFIKNFDLARSKLIKMGYVPKLALVNDGSYDNSKKIVQEIMQSKKYIKLINFQKNYGQQLAIYSALKREKADFYGALDSDCQQDPNYFIKMISKLKLRKVELIQMKKKYGNYESEVKKFFSKCFYYFFSNFTKIDIEPGSSDFYLFTYKVRNKIVSSNSSKLFLRGFVHYIGLNKHYIDYTPLKRIKGRSKYTTARQIDFALTAVYLYAKNYFIGIFVLFLFFNYLFTKFLFDKSFFLNQKFIELNTHEYFSLLSGIISLLISCWLTYFLIRIYKKISIIPKLK